MPPAKQQKLDIPQATCIPSQKLRELREQQQREQTQGPGRRKQQTLLHKSGGLFDRELRLMMYGFGDISQPRADTMEMMEELVMDYVYTLCTSAMNTARLRNNAQAKPAATPTIKMEDLLFSLRKDQKKQKRAEELLFRFDELLKARKAFDTTANPS